MYSYYSFRVLFQVGSDETRLNAVLDLFAQIAREPCFDTLRTKEQLGYIVWYVQYTCAILQFFRENNPSLMFEFQFIGVAQEKVAQIAATSF